MRDATSGCARESEAGQWVSVWLSLEACVGSARWENHAPFPAEG